MLRFVVASPVIVAVVSVCEAVPFSMEREGAAAALESIFQQFQCTLYHFQA